MTLPTPIKTWEIAGPLTATDPVDTNVHKKVQLAIINLLLDGATPATVAGSCDAAAAGMDGVNRWTDFTKLGWGVPGLEAHSWIVLNLVGTGGHQVCFDLSGAGTGCSEIDVYVSPTGVFAGGSTLARPTAADEWAVRERTLAYLFQESGGDTVYLTGWLSSDGACRQIVAYKGGNEIVNVAFLVPRSPASWWTTPLVARVTRCGAPLPAMNVMSAGLLCYLSSAGGYSNRGARAFVSAAMRDPLYYTAQGWGLSQSGYNEMLALATRVIGVDPGGHWPMAPVGQAYNTGALGAGGGGDSFPCGEAFDLYWGSVAIPAGDFAPSLADRQWVKVGHLWMPWGLDATDLETGAVHVATGRDCELVTVGLPDPDTTDPTMTVVSPTPGTELAVDAFLRVQIGDAGGLSLVALYLVRSNQATPELVYWRDAFVGEFAARSTISGSGTVVDPYVLVIGPASGWVRGNRATTVQLEADVVDAAGNYARLSA